jgi:hypothetical protein
VVGFRCPVRSKRSAWATKSGLRETELGARQPCAGDRLKVQRLAPAKPQHRRHRGARMVLSHLPAMESTSPSDLSQESEEFILEAPGERGFRDRYWNTRYYGPQRTRRRRSAAYRKRGAFRSRDTRMGGEDQPSWNPAALAPAERWYLTK